MNALLAIGKMLPVGTRTGCTGRPEPTTGRGIVLFPVLVLSLAMSGCVNGVGLDERRQIAESAANVEGGANSIVGAIERRSIAARPGESLDDVAARAGLSADQLASHNGLDRNYRPRSGEVFALPRQSPPVSSADSLQAIARAAIDRAEMHQSERHQGPADAGFIQHIVEPDDTLASIANVYSVSPGTIVETNGLGSDRSISEGQLLLIPMTSADDGESGNITDATPPAPAAPAATSAPGEQSRAPAPPSLDQPLPARPEEARIPPSPDLGSYRTPPGASGKLLMPVEGEIIRHYAGHTGGGQGIDIRAPAGTGVRAADDGEIALVAPSDTHMTIVLIRHADNLYTVYGRIDGVTLEKGDTVARGHPFAQVASGDPAYLHFQVRRGTESVDPEAYLQADGGT